MKLIKDKEFLESVFHRGYCEGKREGIKRGEEIAYSAIELYNANKEATKKKLNEFFKSQHKKLKVISIKK